MNIDQQLLMDISNYVLRCEDIIENEWEELVVVYDVADGHMANSGFLYEDGDILPISTDIEDSPLLIRDKIVELREIIYQDCGHKFNQMLFQMESKDRRFKIEFDFDDKNPWTINPAKLKEMKVSLKPNFPSHRNLS